MKTLIKIFLNLISSSWMWVVYTSHNNLDFKYVKGICVPIVSSAVIVILSHLSIVFLKYFIEQEELTSFKEIKLVDNEFLPIYLGYFFVAISISGIETFILMYLVVFAFSYCTQDKYINPTMVLLGYHFYDITTNSGVHIFLIKKGRIVKNINEIRLNNLRRINNVTFIDFS